MKTIFGMFVFGVVILCVTACGFSKRPPRVSYPPVRTETTNDTGESGNRVEGMTTIYGLVSHSNGNPANNYTVRIYKKGMRSEEQLGSAVTDSRGSYSVSYASDRTPDTIVAKVYYQAEQVASSNTVYGVREDTIINIVISPSGRGTSEREQEENSVEVERVLDTIDNISNTVSDVIRN